MHGATIKIQFYIYKGILKGAFRINREPSGFVVRNYLHSLV